jgi:hypothetical protein
MVAAAADTPVSPDGNGQDTDAPPVNLDTILKKQGGKARGKQKTAGPIVERFTSRRHRIRPPLTRSATMTRRSRKGRIPLIRQICASILSRLKAWAIVS